VHVLVTSDTLNGNWTFARELVSGLITRGIRVTLVSFGEIPLPEQTAWMDHLYGLSYHPTAFRLEWMEEGRQDFQDASRYLCSLVKESKPDLFHSNHLCYGALPVLIPRIVVAHGDLLTWWKSVHGREPQATPWFAWYRQAMARGLSQVAAVVAPSEWMLNSIRSYYPGGARELVIHYGRNPIFFNPYVPKENSVLTIGRLLDPAKQVNLLTLESHNVPVAIVAEDAVAEHRKVPVRADVQFRDGNRGVALKGAQTEAQLRALYSKAAIYAGTSRYEPGGMAILEAALSRCALILNDIPPFREIWGNAAIYFRTNEAGSLAEAVRIVSSDEQMRRNFANRAFQRARECFNTHRMTDSYIQLYASIASRRAFAA
jgi:glycogen synthase